MTDDVKARRRYESPRRREQADATRAEILRAGARLFETQGYAATTMGAVAAGAGVSLKTVYLAFETKSGIVRALWDVGLRGERDVAVADLDWYRRVLDEPDPARALRLNAANSRRVKERLGGLQWVIRTAAPLDEDIAALWRHIQTDFHANQRVVVESLAGRDALRPDLDVARAADILWALNHPDVWHLFVGERGWTPAEYERWFGDTAVAQLLR
jgi:AcrR family transcriptional regulator